MAEQRRGSLRELGNAKCLTFSSTILKIIGFVCGVIVAVLAVLTLIDGIPDLFEDACTGDLDTWLEQCLLTVVVAFYLLLL